MSEVLNKYDHKKYRYCLNTGVTFQGNEHL